MPTQLDWSRFKRLGEAQIGKPYIYGATADISCPNPVAFDCAELVYWLYGQVGLKISNYSDGQFRASVPSTPRLGDLGFFRVGKEPTHHVGIWWNKDNVLEARGEPYNKVIYRPVQKWEAWKEFTGWRRPISVVQRERAS